MKHLALVIAIIGAFSLKAQTRYGIDISFGPSYYITDGLDRNYPAWNGSIRAYTEFRIADRSYLQTGLYVGRFGYLSEYLITSPDNPEGSGFADVYTYFYDAGIDVRMRHEIPSWDHFSWGYGLSYGTGKRMIISSPDHNEFNTNASLESYFHRVEAGVYLSYDIKVTKKSQIRLSLEHRHGAHMTSLSYIANAQPGATLLGVGFSF